MEVYTKIMEVVKDFEDLKSVKEIEQHHKYSDFLIDSESIGESSSIYMSFNATNLFTFCDWISVCFDRNNKMVSSIQFCVDYFWLVEYNLKDSKLYTSAVFDFDSDFDIKTMDETEEIVLRYSIELNKK